MKKYIFGLTFAILFVSNCVYASVVIDLKPDAQVNDTYICLRDIADFLAGDKLLIEEMGQIIVARAPVPGVTVFIRDIEVKAALQRNNLLKNVKIQGNDKTMVNTVSITVKGEDVQAAAKEFILDNMPDTCTDVEVYVFNKPSDLIFKEGNVTLSVVPASKNYLSGNVVVIVQVMLNGEIEKKVPVNLRIKIFDQVVVCNRAIGREEMISASDLSLGRREVTKINQTPLKDISEAIGKVVRRRIKAQTVLTQDMLLEPILVKRRSLVNLVLPFKTLNITSKGIAKTDGRRGEYIVVENLDTKKEIYGEVISGGVVRVNM